jgi:hypothetical protein
MANVTVVDTACTDPNHMAISSWTTRLGVQGAFLGDVSMIHWMQSAWLCVSISVSVVRVLRKGRVRVAELFAPAWLHPALGRVPVRWEEAY